MPGCAETGVIGVLPGIVGTLQANEVVKLITGLGEILSGRLLSFDALSLQFDSFTFSTDPSNKEIKELGDYNAFCDALQEITAEELKYKMQVKQDFQLVDVREEKEYQVKNIGGILIPLSVLENHLSEISREKEIVVHCASGVRSKKAVSILKEKGFKKVYSLKNGLLDF
jgi:adenylyltransferase/sulfurtransferase